MATANYANFGWIGPEGGDFLPGEAHYWWMTGFSPVSAISVTAHSVVGDPDALHRVLEIQDVRVDGDPGGHTLLFTVRNVGGYSTPAYGLGISWISR